MSVVSSVVIRNMSSAHCDTNVGGHGTVPNDGGGGGSGGGGAHCHLVLLPSSHCCSPSGRRFFLGWGGGGERSHYCAGGYSFFGGQIGGVELKWVFDFFMENENHKNEK